MKRLKSDGQEGMLLIRTSDILPDMKTCLMFPGNPAVADYYEEWIREISRDNPDLRISYASSYVLFDRRLSSKAYDDALLEYYESIFLKLYDGQPVTLIAHSAGSYFALRLLEKHPDKVGNVVLLFPYLGRSTIAWLRLVKIPYLIDRFFPLAELVSRFRFMFSGWYGGDHGISNEDLTACLRFGVRKCDLFNSQPFDPRRIAAWRERVHFFYTDNDKWCPAETVRELGAVSHAQKVSIPHDFIVSRENREKMQKHVMKIL